MAKITPPLVGQVQAAGLTRAQLERDHRKNVIWDEKYFKASALPVKQDERFFFVGAKSAAPTGSLIPVK